MIHVVDEMMGAGKTSAAISMINEAPPETRFIYITPFLDEVERIKASCADRHFYSPEKQSPHGAKIQDLKALLFKKENIVTTHALFHLFDDEVIDVCRAYDYVLIMDEVTSVIEQFEMTSQDRAVLFERFVHVDENGIIKWNEDEADYSGRFSDVKRLADMECLACYGGEVLMWLFPVKIFNAFKESYILTYMFEGQMQCWYYKYFGMEYENLYVYRQRRDDGNDRFWFTEQKVQRLDPADYAPLVSIVDDERLNKVGEIPQALSKSWFDRNKDNPLMKQLKNNIINFFNNRKTHTGNVATTRDALWTTFKQYRDIIKGKGYTKGFLPINARATNNYADRSVVAYIANRYMDPFVKKFFTGHGITVDEDAFALSEMIQFIWRSAIRNGEPITVYIPSRRMRELLINWLSSH